MQGRIIKILFQLVGIRIIIDKYRRIKMIRVRAAVIMDKMVYMNRA